MAPPNVENCDKDTTYRPITQMEPAVSEPTCKCDDPKEFNKLLGNGPVDSADLDDFEDAVQEAEVVVPPDGGWGWVVVFSSFMCNMIVDGIIFSFSTFLGDIISTFQVSTAEASLVSSLMSGFYLITGPFASALANRYGFRLVAVVGGFLGAFAFVISYFATSIEFLWITYGIIGGIGFGFIYVPSVITVGFYFERWRALATGIAVCGSGIGTFLFAPLSKQIISAFGWRTALLIQGAIVLSCAAFGALFRPLKPKKVKDIANEEIEKELVMDPARLPEKTRLKMEEALKSMKRTSIDSTNAHHSITPFSVNNNSQYLHVEDVYHTIAAPARLFEVRKHEKRLSVPFIHPQKDKQLLPKNLTPIIVPKLVSESNKEVNRPMYREDIFFGASLSRLPQYTSRTSLGYNLAVTQLPSKNDIDEERKRTCKLCPEAVRRTLATMLDVSLLKSPSFLILAVGGFFTMMGFYIPFMFIVDRACELGDMDPQSGVWLISSIGIANTVGRVLCGVLSSFPGVNALLVTNVALTLGGVATALSGFFLNTEAQFLYSVIFGLSISCFASLRSIIVVDLLGLEKLTNAFGLLLLFQGVAAIIGAPLASAFMKAAGTYNATFYLSGSMLALSAIMCYPLNYINRREMRKNDKSVPV